jgi:hypothetical protein
MLKPISWLLLAGIGAAAAGCHKAATDQGPVAAASSEALPPPRSEAPRSVRLAIQLVAMRTPARLAPAAPKVVEPSHDLYDTPGARPADPPSAEAPGFRLTVPLCRRAERLDDPLAKTAECAQLIEAAKAQAAACKQAFEAGDDKSALSPACRQAAGFR